MSTSKTNEQAFEALIERALIGTTLEERKESGQTDVDTQAPDAAHYYWGKPSDFEKKVLSRYIQGESYVKIAEKLDSPVKSVDNAIQRIRKKTAKSLSTDSNML